MDPVAFSLIYICSLTINLLTSQTEAETTQMRKNCEAYVAMLNGKIVQLKDDIYLKT